MGQSTMYMNITRNRSPAHFQKLFFGITKNGPFSRMSKFCFCNFINMDPIKFSKWPKMRTSQSE